VGLSAGVTAFGYAALAAAAAARDWNRRAMSPALFGRLNR